MAFSKILIVDDEPTIVRLLSMSLKSDGYDTCTAVSGEEALDVFEKQSPDIVATSTRPGWQSVSGGKQKTEPMTGQICPGRK